ncbi:MAG: B12-binding domain-containing radical SAM protein [Smithellaceae bacterium]
MKHVTIIVPPVVVHHLDPHTGIPFMPHIAAYAAAALKQAGYGVQVLDCLGLQPHERQVVGEFMLLGLNEREVARNISPETRVCFIYCRTISELIAVSRMIAAIKSCRRDIKICLFENTQAVTSFSLRDLAADFFKDGADVLILGDPEDRMVHLTDRLIKSSGIKDIHEISFLGSDGQPFFTVSSQQEVNVDSLPFPAWEIFPLEGYWLIGFAHAPIGGDRFLPILTSRGCPYKCLFCVAPTLSNNWRPRLASSVVDEMEYFYKAMGVREFHVSDFNPTVSDERVREICNLILRRSLPVTWKLAQGTKIETIKNEETLELMAKAGCSYISFSPESGSKRMLKSVNKPFDFEHGLRMTRKMSELGIKTQACFIAGLPGEEKQDRVDSLNYVKKLVAAGVDEINVPVFTPVPGSGLSKAIDGYTQYAQCTFSPTWRSDYREVNSFRYRMYLTFFLHKLKHPRKVFREIKGLLTGRFQTKMEMSFFKLIKLFILRYCPCFFQGLNYGPDHKVL